MACRMIRAALIRNPSSHRNLASSDSYRLQAREWLGPCFAEPAAPGDMHDVLADFAQRGVNLLIIDGGDGTLHKVLSALPPEWEKQPPRMAIMASGNTNLVAGDVGSGVRGVKGLRRLIDWTPQEVGRVRSRSCLEIRWEDEAHPVVRGMFFGAAAFTRGTDIAHRKIHRRGFFHKPAVLFAIVASLGHTLLAATRRQWLMGDAMEIATDGQTALKGDRFLFLATSLDRLMLGIWPFWNDGGAAIRYLDVDATPKRLPGVSLALLRRRIPQWLRDAEDFRSGGANTIEMSLSERFVLDGEVFEPGPLGKILIRPGPQIEFVTL